MIRYTKWAIWLYIILLMFEGALRKWVMPSWSSPLLVIRDPVLLLIYVFAIGADALPRTRFMVFLGILAVASICFSLLAGQHNLFVTLYGLRTNYLHVPLIWVMGAALTRKDVERIGVFILVTAIAMTGLMIWQFKAPIESWVNKGIGTDEGGQIYGAAGHIRPPGFFTFITGPMVFFPLAMAFLLHFISSGRQRWWRVGLLIASGLAIAIALPVSISRGTMIATLLVLAVYGFSLFKVGILNTAFLRFGAMGLFLLVGLSFLPIFKEAREAFMDRWDTAADQAEGNAVGSLVLRVTGAFTQPIDIMEHTPVFGYGIGVGTNAGAAMLAGQVGFLLAEDEWSRVILELGGMLGIAYIIFRISITVHLGLLSIRALWMENDMLPLLLYSAAAWVILINQWGQPTQLGFAIIGGGLLLASLNGKDDEDDDADEEDDEDDETDDDETEDETDDEDEDEDTEAEDEDEESEEEPAEKSHEMSEHEARRRRMRGL
ncbi:MAG: hypothetical protein QM790_11145 [Nibricoccus sp.]